MSHQEPKTKKLEEILKDFLTNNDFVAELAARDANLYGYGLIAVDKEGHFMYVDYEEAQIIIEAMKQNEAQRNR